jgi:hypothetical protein
MFIIEITAINPSAQSNPDSGTASLIPSYLATGGDRPIQATISIDSAEPYKGAEILYAGNDQGSISEWLPDQYGMYGKSIDDSASPMDLVAALTAATWLEWKIISGQTILDHPTPESISGAMY